MRLLRFGIVAIALAFLAWQAYAQLGHPGPGIDDARIFFVFARNILAGHGIVYVPGGERVEGFSSPLWLAVITLLAASLHNYPWGLLGLNVILVSSLIAVYWHLLDGNRLLTWRGAILLIWILSSPAFVVWEILSLMDITLWTVVLGFGVVVILYSNSKRWLSIVVALVLLTRSEGLLWSAVLIVSQFLFLYQPQHARRAFKFVLPAIITGAVVLGGLTIFRLAYFGYPLPNTYYAKVSPNVIYNLTEGGKYLVSFLNSNLLLWGVLAIALWAIIKEGWKIFRASQATATPANKPLFILALVTLTGMLGPVLTGGDHFPQFRFYQPLWPIIPMLYIKFIDQVLESKKEAISIAPVWRGVSLAGMGALIAIFPNTTWLSLAQYQRSVDNFRLGMEFFYADEGTGIATALNQLFPTQPPSTGVIGIGGFALTYSGQTVDLVGLTSVAMAHAPGDRFGFKNHAAFNPEVFFQLRPQLVLPSYAYSRATLSIKRIWDPWDFGVLKGVFATTRFWREYQPAIVSNGRVWIAAYVARDYLQELSQGPWIVEEITPLQTGIYSPFDFSFTDPTKFKEDYVALVNAIASEDQASRLLVYPPHQMKVLSDLLNNHPGITPIPIGDLPLDPQATNEQLATATAQQTRIRIVLLDSDQGDPQRYIETWLNTHLFRVNESWFGPLRVLNYFSNNDPPRIEEGPVHFKGGITLDKIDVTALRINTERVVCLRLVWHADESVPQAYKFFVHIYNTAGIVGQYDGYSFGELRPTNTWQPGESIVDQVAISLPKLSDSNPYFIRVGLYDLDSQERLPVTEPNGEMAEFYVLNNTLDDRGE